MRKLYPVQVQGEPNRINLIFLNNDRNFSTFLTIMDLVKHERVADIYTLSRSMFESIISMGLLAKSIVADGLNRYQEYQFTEIHKTYTHLVRLGLQQLSGVNPSDANLVKQRSQEYISKYGRNLSTWTSRGSTLLVWSSSRLTHSIGGSGRKRHLRTDRQALRGGPTSGSTRLASLASYPLNVIKSATPFLRPKRLSIDRNHSLLNLKPKKASWQFLPSFD